MASKKQIIFIHGGTAFSKYADFLTYLQECTIHEPLSDVPKRWKNTLRSELGERYEVYFPSMPNKQNAKYEEWKIWFERYFEFLHDEVVLIGHSQGGYFLAKYLSENNMRTYVKALYLIAAPIRPDEFGSEDGGDFNFDVKKLSHIANETESIFIFHSVDDPIVPYGHGLEYKRFLPNAHFLSFEDKGHFLIEAFPEIIKSIKDLEKILK